ncbi:MAG: hypothetical protein V7637_4460 [Mycobacteriales bacterium]
MSERSKTRGVAVAATLTLLAAGVVAVAQAPAGAVTRLAVQPDPSVPGRTVAATPFGADAAAKAAGRPVPAAVWPAPGSATLTVPPATTGAAPAASTPASAGGLPVRAAAPTAATPASGPAPGPARAPASGPTRGPAAVRVQVLPRRGVDRPEVLLRVGRTDGGAASGPVSLSVSDTAFRTAYGADWVNRLRLEALPDCALSTPDRAGCQGRALPSTGGGSGWVTADVTAAGAGDTGTLYALAAGPSGSAGSFAATTLSPSSVWAAGGVSGDFGWTYPIRVPPAPGGLAPQVELGYSAQSVSGRTAATNNQPSWLGEGFDYAPGSIDRAYKACADDMGGTANNTTKTGDECWATGNATMTLNGRTVELVRDDATGAYRPRDDDGSRVEHLTGAANGADGGEYWRVTTTDGTQYYFGLNHLPGWATGKPVTNSAWTVPVFGNNPGEPHHQATFDASWAQQAWRWNLDYVVDRHGDSMSYWYTPEGNSYARDNDAAKVTPYTRGGTLARVDYGTRTGAEFGTAPAQVVFGVADRCASTCATHGANWPDTPWDLACSGTSCLTGSPTFWTTKRLATITTHVAAVGDVESWTLAHTYPDPGDATRAGLWLAGISHKGLVGGTATVPDVTFTGVQRPNRVDTDSDQLPAMNWWRVASIRTGTGAEITVSYSAPDCAAGSRMPAAPESDTLRCYPVKWTPDGWTSQKLDWFQQYVTTDVSQTDHTGGAPRVLTHYDYSGGAAWHYVDVDGLIPPSQQTWSSWRGYGQVTTTTGDPGGQTATTTTYFRGMDGDKLPSGVRHVSVADAAGDAVADTDALSGQQRETIVRNGSAEVTGTVSDPYLSAPTATRTIAGVTVVARHTGPAVTETRTALDGGRGYRRTRTSYQHDGYGLVTQQDDTGDEAATGDEQCTRTTYARNTGSWVLSLPDRVEVDALACAATPASAEDITSDTRTSYDNQAWGAAPTHGDATQVDVLADFAGGAPTYLTDHRAAYDAYGRVTDTWDVKNGHSTTSYSPATGPVTRQTTADQKGFSTVTDLQPAWGVPVGQTDPNGKRTDLAYDPFGRLISVWLPGRAKASQGPSTSYGYTIRTDGAAAVSTAELGPNGTTTTSYQLYDGLLRPRQTQRPASGPDGGRVVTDTYYDSAGRAYETNADYVTDGAPGADLFGPAGDNVIPNQTLTLFDGAGRPTAAVQRSLGVEQWRTTTGYGGDRTDVTPPAGGIATSTVTDARGHTVELRQYHGATPSGPYDGTSYRYDARNLLGSVTGPGGSTWAYHYDARGRQVRVDDPDQGTSSSRYDDAGEVVSTTDARGATVAYSYDELGRRTAGYAGSTAGTKLAEWTYDTLPGGAAARGQLVSATRYVDGNAYTSTVTGYDDRYQPTGGTVSIPAAEGALAGTYTFGNTYKVDGSLSTVTQPAAGGLPRETLGVGYDDLGEPATLTGSTSYLTQAQYTRYGEPAIYTFSVNGPDSGPIAQTGLYYDPVTRRPAEARTIRETSPSTVADVHYGWNPGGELTSVADTQSADTQCFGYDAVQRLTQAWTPASANCAAAPTTAGLGGPAPYWQSWTYDAAGDRASETDHATGGDVTSRYAYPAADQPQPHAVSSVTTTGPAGTSTDRYGYDPAGDTLSRPGPGGGTEQLTWDATGALTTVAGATTASYVDGADGQLLVAHDTTGATLYLPGLELHLAPGAGAPTATRFYTFGGRVIGQRSSAGVTWLVPDWQGTEQIAIGADGGQPVTQRRQTPFGDPRGPAVAWPNRHGFVGGVDQPTGLTDLGARAYDPDTGRFASVDPEFDSTDPQQTQGYAYADNDPTTHSDPTGLHLACGGMGGDYTPCPPGGGGTTGCAVLGCGNPNSGTNVPPRSIHPAGTYGRPPCTNAVWWMCTTKPKPDPPKPKRKAPPKPKPHGGTGAVCFNFGVGAFWQAGAAYCLGVDQHKDKHGHLKNGLFGEVTDVTPRGGKGGLGFGLGVTLQGSNAKDKDGLAGPFGYGSGSIGPVQGGVAAGGGVEVVELGVSAGPSSGQGGTSNTTVTDYWAEW